MKKNKLILVAVIGLFATMVFSCKKPAQLSSIIYVNDTYTPVSITVNGSTQTIAVGSSITFIANVGTEANVRASTSGTYGVPVPWSFTEYFPSVSGDQKTEPLDVPASLFYLKVVNTYSATVTALEVNVGLTAQTNDSMMAIANNGSTYDIGYFDAFSNTEILATYNNSTYLLVKNISIPNTLNASYTANL